MKIFLRSLLLVITLVFSNAIIAQKLYWVGGSGNFNDPNHWSFSSDGLGGAKTPSITDDVYFDENSFRSNSVINIIGGASCHDLIFADNIQAVILNGTQNEKLTIGGNATFNQYVTNKFLGDVWFNSTQQNNNLKIGFGAFLGNVYFDGGGSWSLQSRLTLSTAGKTLAINSGKLNLVNKLVVAQNLNVSSQASISLQKSMIYVYNTITSSSSSGIVGDNSSTLFFSYSNNSSANYSQVRIKNTESLASVGTPTYTNILPVTCYGYCDGQFVISFPADTAPYTIQLYSSSGLNDQTFVTSSTTYTVLGLCADTYGITVVNNNDHYVASDLGTGVVIPNPTPLKIVAGSKIRTDPTCFGLCNGAISYQIGGSHPNYTVVWTTPSATTFTHTNVAASPSVESLSSLCVGTYTYNITDSKGCILKDTITLTQPSVIVPNGGVKAPSCSNSNNGMAWVVPTGGTAFTSTLAANGIKYTTVWDGSATAANHDDTLYNLMAGSTHTCVVTDKNGCTATYVVTVPPAPLPFSFTKTNNSPLNCNNVCNGVITVNSVSGGTPTYTLSWSPSGPTVTGTSSTNTNLCAGNYTCTIKDAHGCDTAAIFTITSPPAITHSLTIINPKCNGQTSGSIKDSLSGGTSVPTGYTFTWTPVGTVTSTTSSSTNSNLGPGSYSVVSTDSKGCKDTAKVTLINPPVLTATITPTNPTCFGFTNGQACVAASGGTGSIYTYTWTPTPPPLPHTSCISGLGAGSYTVVVSDSNHCTKTVSVTLTAPPQINISVVKVNPTCAGLCNGTAVVTATGGSGAGYTYSWSCAPGNTTNSLSGQCGGTTCTVTVTDGSGCSQSKVITFTNPNPLSITASATPLVCANQCNSQITTNVIGGTPNYTYTWSGAGVNNTAPDQGQNGMCAGSYTVVVKDSNNCTATANVTVSAPNPLVIAATFTNPSCSGGNNGAINATITGGSLPYGYTWNPFINPLTLTPNNLASGAYVLSVIDGNGCTASQTVTLINPTPVTASVVSTSVTCAGSCNGTATVTALGGTPPYLYSWDGAAYTATTNTLNLCAGTHTVQVKDANGCTAASVIYTIVQPTALTAAVSNITKSCLNICNGTATASASGGSGSYMYSWDAPLGPFSAVTTINTLCIGTHTLYVQDANGCTASTVFNVQVIINVNILANTISVSCHGVCDGSASATASGGSGPYTFQWIPALSSPPPCTNVSSCTANNLCPQTYTVKVTDQTGCASEDSVTILNPPVLMASVTTIDATCFGMCNGSATITPSGGTAPYTEQWSNNGIIGANPTGLCPGTYTATVVDNRGCTVSNPIVIGSSPQFTVVPTVSSPTACLSSTGSISLAISGGTPTYTLTWNTGSHVNPLTGLAAGIYTATISDSKGCDTTLTIGVSDPTGPTTSMVVNQNVSCHGFCDGSATVSGTGVAPINVTWTSGTPTGLNSVTDNTLCAGSYPVKVSDGNGCITIENVTITQPTQIMDNAIITPLTCSSGNTGVITLNPSGGSGVPYTFTLNGVATTNPITNLSAGVQTVTITDSKPCSTTYTYNIAAPTALVITVTKTNELCAGACNGTAQASITGGTPAYTYTWTNSLGAVVSNNPNVAGLCPGTYTLSVKDSHNCTGQTIVTINAAVAILPNLVTQNNNCNTGCTGAATVTPTGGSGGGYTYSWNTVGSPTGTSVSSVCPGNYFVTITDTNHCAITTTFTLTAPPTVTASVVYTRPTCFGYANGSATITPSGGTPTYTVTWNPAVCVGCVSTNSLVAGSYVATVTDSKGCNGSVSFTINDTTKLNSNAVATNPFCNNNCNGSITSSPIGGNGGYNWQWQGIVPSPGNSPMASGLCPGTYTLIVVDSKNCRDTAHVTLTNPPPINLTLSSQPATCGQSNGVVTITNVTGTGTLAINWLAPSTCSTSPTCSNLAAGIYSVTLTDANNCKDTFQIGVTNSNGPIVNLTTTNVTCFGSCNGTALVTASAGTPGTTGYTYSWTTVPVVTTNSVSGLCASPPSYISTVTDSLLCKALTTFSISGPPKITDNPTIVNATCAGINNGSITSSGSGGTPSVLTGYLYSIDGGAFSSNNIFTGLGVGTHTVCIKDSLSCSDCFIYNIQGSTIIISTLSSTNNLCFGVCNATASLSNVNGGAAPYIITWNDPNGQAGPIAINLCAGSYTATITDTMGCKVTQVANITAPTTSVSPNYTVTPPACGLCNGIISLSPSGGNGPAYTYTWNTSGTTPNITNVCAGLYQVDIADMQGCTTTYQIPVSNSNAPTAVITSTNVSCGGTCDGAASIAASAGTAPYTYNWVSPSATTPSISSLCAGTYYVQVKDAANCVQTQSVTITAPPTIVLNQIITPTDCGKCNGSVNVAPTGGSGVYTYTWNGVSSTMPQTNLCAGSYTLVVSDGTCSKTSFIDINSSNAPLVTITVTNPTCSGLSTGSATATIIGGVPVITTVWSNGASTNPDTGLGAGTYNLVVTDNNGCAAVQTFTITSPTPIALSLNNTQLPSCTNVCNGLLTAIPSGGTLPYTYTWTPVPSNQDTIGHLCAGSYTVNVTDANGCAISQISTLVNNPFLISANPTIVQPSCAQCNGSITLAPSGGNNPYTYTWTTSPINNTNQETNACAGIYQVDITDGIGCKQTESIPVSSSNSPTLTVTSTNVTCNGLSNGSATATATGGILPYMYSWPTLPSTNTVVTGLTSGIYFVQVKDSAGCIATQSVNVTEPTALNANATMVSPTSCSACDGSINTAVTGGSGSYTYSWSTGVSTPNITNACAGIYTLVVTDGVTNCKDTLPPIGLNGPTGPALTIASTDEKCFGVCNGSATVTASGGAGPAYSYTWTPNVGSGPIVTGLCANQSPFMVEVSDNAGCVTTQSVTINEPTKLITSLPTITPVKCFNDANGAINTVVSGGTPSYTYVWNPATATGSNPQNLAAGIYSLTVTDINGCTNTGEIDTLKNPTQLAITGTTTPASCNNTPNGTITTITSGGTPGYIWLWSNASVNPNLPAVLPGNYSFTVTDSHGCTKDTNFIVISTVTITVNAGRDTSLCSSASVVLTGTVTGSVTYNWYDAGVLIPPANSLTVSVNPAATTEYVLIATNSGCTNSDTVQVSISPVAVANAGPDQSVLSGQGITIGGNPTNPGGGTVVWTPYLNLSDTSATNPTASPTLTTTYYVVVTNSAGCKAKDSMIVTVLPPFDIPNGFTPNGDGKNDTWMLDNLYKFPNAEVEVYNRWGEQLFYSRGNYQAWGGTYNGSPVPVGTYYYIIKLNDKNYPDHYAGPLTILR